MVIGCNNEITDVKYSGFTITKIYACGGEVVYEKETPIPPIECDFPTDFVLNYNAKQYDASTYTMPLTYGQTNGIDCVLSGDVENIIVGDDYIDLSNTTAVKALVSGNANFNRNNTDGQEMTIIAKAYKPNSSIDSDVLVNRTSIANWMFRWTNEKAKIEGATGCSYVSVSSSEPNIILAYTKGNNSHCSLDCSDVYIENFTTSTSGTYSGDTEEFIFRYGYTTSNGGALFAEKANTSNANFWKGKFYWIFMAQRDLTRSEVQAVINYNEYCIGREFQWNKADASDYACDMETHTKYYKEYYQYSDDSGTTWNNTTPVSSRTSSDVIEYNSVDCGYIPPFEGKYKLTLNDSSVVTGACDSTSAVTREELIAYQSNVVRAEISECVSTIGQSAFYYCSGLTDVTISDSVTLIDRTAFNGCSGLTSVTIGNSVSTIGEASFEYCNALTDLTFPDSVQRINGYAVYQSTGLTSVTIGSGITIIVDYAFNGCISLQSITIKATTPPQLRHTGTRYYTFDDTNNCPIYVPSASVDAYKSSWARYSGRIYPIP